MKASRSASWSSLYMSKIASRSAGNVGMKSEFAIVILEVLNLGELGSKIGKGGSAGCNCVT